MNHRFLQTGLVALSLFCAASASAQDPGQDEVTLKNGGSIRGTVVSSEPGTSVKIIELGQKEVRVIPWSQVSDVERGKYGPRGAAQPGFAGPGYGAPPPPVAPPAPQMGAPGVVRLHIDSPVPAQLIEHGGTAIGAVGGYGVVIHQLRPVCMAPCDRVVDGSAGQAFTLSGDFTTPRVFNLVGMSGDVNLSVEPGSRGLRIGGVWLTIIGGSTALGGLVMLPIALNSYSGSSLKTAAGVMAGVGGAMLIGGIAMIATSGTKLTLEQRAPRTGQLRPRYWLGEF